MTTIAPCIPLTVRGAIPLESASTANVKSIDTINHKLALQNVSPFNTMSGCVNGRTYIVTAPTAQFPP
jgi:hypothetical protein